MLALNPHMPAVKKSGTKVQNSDVTHNLKELPLAGQDFHLLQSECDSLHR